MHFQKEASPSEMESIELSRAEKERANRHHRSGIKATAQACLAHHALSTILSFMNTEP